MKREFNQDESESILEVSLGSDLFDLDPACRYLNHGSFGACTRPVRAHRAALLETIDRQPHRFLARELEARLDEARRVLAEFIGAEAEGLAWVFNATSGFNSVLRSLQFAQGDELLVTDHAYNACRTTMEFVAQRWGAKIVVAELPFPLADPAEMIDAVLAVVSDKTAIAVLDHVSSPTGLILPIEALVRELENRGVPVLVDGAHAPGMLELDVEALGASWYTGNCHKWLGAPRSVGFLWTREDRRSVTRPVIISHGANSAREDRSRYLLEFDWVGTWDPTPALSVPLAIETLGSLLPGGWHALRQRNRALALLGRRMLADALEIAVPAPDSMIGTLAALPLPALINCDSCDLDIDDPTRNRLVARGFEVPFFLWPGPPQRVIRISCFAYNTLEDYRALASALAEELARERTGSS